MPPIKIPTPPKPTQPKTKTDWLPIFNQWAEGRTGFTPDQLVDLFAQSYGLTAQETKDLRAKVKAATPKTPTPTQTPKTPEPKKVPPSSPLIITRTPYPKWWKDLRVSGIGTTGQQVQAVTSGGGNYNTYVACIVIVVNGPCSVSFGFGTMGASGVMELGDTDEPRGMVISMGDSPAPCGQGGFSVHAIPDDQETGVGGFVVYYVEKTQT